MHHDTRRHAGMPSLTDRGNLPLTRRSLEVVEEKHIAPSSCMHAWKRMGMSSSIPHRSLIDPILAEQFADACMLRNGWVCSHRSHPAREVCGCKLGPCHTAPPPPAPAQANNDTAHQRRNVTWVKGRSHHRPQQVNREASSTPPKSGLDPGLGRVGDQGFQSSA